MSKRIWHSGPPPHVGWWNASGCENLNIWRWWDGKRWSCWVDKEHNIDDAHFFSQIKENKNVNFHWTTYYPKNARVPRIDPRRK